jgi:ATP-dependent Lon protease
MFVCTANSLNLPQPLLDRMEIIRLEGYTEDEKVEIAERHLVRKQIEAHGLKVGEFTLTQPALRDLIRYYTREAACARWSAKLPGWRASRCAASGRQGQGDHDHAENLTTLPVSGNSATAFPTKRTRSVRSPVWPGPKWAANC